MSIFFIVIMLYKIALENIMMSSKSEAALQIKDDILSIKLLENIATKKCSKLDQSYLEIY
jgi:hypothetical protein